MVIAFSFCLYNPPNDKYYVGLLENIALIQKHFPQAYTYVYIGNDVPESFVDELRSRKNVALRFTNETGAVNMIHRFFAIDEPGVDLMFVRDADSRVHWKDRWAIREFMNTSWAKAHAIRDNPVHNTAILGGLWGMYKIAGINIRSLYYATRSARKDFGMGLDQDFLIECIYPRVASLLMIHSSQTWKFRPSEVLHPFPFTFSNEIYCGRIEEVNYIEPEVSQPAFNRSSPVVSLLKILPRSIVKLSK